MGANSTKYRLLAFAGLLRFIKREISPKLKVSFFKRLKMWAKGFSAESSVYYDFKKYKARDYLSEYQMYCKAIKINTGYTEVLNNKLAFYCLVNSFAKIPEIYGFIEKGKIVSLNSKISSNSTESLIDYCSKGNDIIIKIFEGSSGFGVLKLHSLKGDLFLNGKITNKEEVERLIGSLDKYLISECVKQSDYLNKIFPFAINSMKVLTMIDPDTNDPFIVGAFHRIGTKKSIPVDNIGPGGSLAYINLDTGIMTAAYSVKERRLVWFDNHPDTGAPIKGVKIPNWEQIKNQVLELAGNLSFIKYIAWDIAVQDNGIVVLEGNANTDTIGFQPFKPLLCDERVRRFYKHHKVIK